MQRWKLHFFCIFCCICFGAVPCFFAFFRFFFRKTIQKLIKVAKKCNGENATSQVARKNATEKMQRWKLLFFALSVPLFLAFAFSVAFLDFPDLLQLALWCCLEFSRQGMLLIEGGTATSLGARRHNRSGTAWLTACLPFFRTISKLETSNLTKLLHFRVLFSCIFFWHF